IALASNCPRASLSCRTTRARRATCTALSITTARPTMVVTAAICLALMLSRMRGNLHHHAPQRRRDAERNVSISASPRLCGPRKLASSRLLNCLFVLFAWSPAPEFIQLVVQRLEADAEDLGGAGLV